MTIADEFYKTVYDIYGIYQDSLQGFMLYHKEITELQVNHIYQ